MSNIAPDIPELRAVPESARAMVYMGALSAAIRSPTTWIPGVMLLLLVGAFGATQGYRLFGIVGAMAGAGLGIGAAAVFFFKIQLPSCARRLLPALLKEIDPRTFEPIARADDTVVRMIDEYKRREMPQSNEKES